MRLNEQCPKCAHKRLAVIAKLRAPGATMTPLPVLVVSASRGLEAVGSFETWVCLGCGYAELYVDMDDLAAIEALAERHPEEARILDPGAPTDTETRPRERGPYR